MRALVGLVHLRATSTDSDMQLLPPLGLHLRSLGKEVPILALTNEATRSLSLWDPTSDVDLEASPYDLEQLPY